MQPPVPSNFVELVARRLRRVVFASLVFVLGCSTDPCPSSLSELCAQQSCPTSPRAAASDPETYPQVLALDGAFVIGLSDGYGGAQYHFQGSKLVGFLGYTDQLGGECPSTQQFGTLIANREDLYREKCPMDEPDCILPCTFNPDWVEAHPLCSADILPSE
jgi:hypothetical protein